MAAVLREDLLLMLLLLLGHNEATLAPWLPSTLRGFHLEKQRFGLLTDALRESGYRVMAEVVDADLALEIGLGGPRVCRGTSTNLTLLAPPDEAILSAFRLHGHGGDSFGFLKRHSVSRRLPLRSRLRTLTVVYPAVYDDGATVVHGVDRVLEAHPLRRIKMKMSTPRRNTQISSLSAIGHGVQSGSGSALFLRGGPAFAKCNAARPSSRHHYASV